MPGIVTNQFQDLVVTDEKIALLDAPLKYIGAAATVGAIINDGDLVNKAYIDAVIFGPDPALSVRAATTENLLATASGTGPGKTITNLDPDFPDLSIDGFDVSTGDLVLLQDMGGEIFSFTLDTTEAAGNYEFADESGSGFGRYWEFSVPNGIGTELDYYVWYDTNNGSTDPGSGTDGDNAPTSGAQGVQVDIATGANGETVCDNTVTAISGQLGGFAVTVIKRDEVASTQGTVYVVSTNPGNVTDVKNGNGVSADMNMPGTPAPTVEEAGTGSVTTGSPHNGVYAVTQTDNPLENASPGANLPNSQNWILTRTTSYDETAEVTTGKFYFTESGTINKGSSFVLTSTGAITVDTTAQFYALYSVAGSIIAGDGLTRTSGVLDINVDNSTIEINADALRLKDAGLTRDKMAEESVGPFQLIENWGSQTRYGFFVEDGVAKVSWTGTTPEAERPHFASSVEVVVAETGTFVTGDAIDQVTNAAITGIFLSFDDSADPTRMYYLPTSDHTDATGTPWGGSEEIQKVGSAGAVKISTAVAALDSAEFPLANPVDLSPNGTKQTFVLSNTLEGNAHTILDSSVEVWRNGAKMKRVENDPVTAGRPGVDIFYFDSATSSIKFGTAPSFGEEITCRWVAKT